MTGGSTEAGFVPKPNFKSPLEIHAGTFTGLCLEHMNCSSLEMVIL
jgi:hypothetical protein